MFSETKIGDLSVIEPSTKALMVIEKVLELNKIIVQQNEMIVKTLTNLWFTIKEE